MKFIHPSIEILEQGPGIQGIYDMVELCGKTSYKSEVKGGKTAEDFTSARVNEGHYAVLEFGTVYLKYPSDEDFVKYHENPYSAIRLTGDGDFAVTTNLRVLVENGWTLDLKYLCEPTEHHVKRYTARIITDRGVSHELVRHRAFSFCQESTRYCNYGKDKFGSEITFIEPTWYNEAEGVIKSSFESFLKYSEDAYMDLLDHQYTPQQARQVLPNALKTEICMCGFEKDWGHFFALRYYGITGKPHPSMYKVAEMLKFGFEEKGINF